MALPSRALSVRSMRSLHQSTMLLRSKKEYPVLKPAPSQPIIETEWVPPAFPAEVQPSTPFTDKDGKQWNVLVSACLFRFPKITLDPTKEELEYAAFRQKMDIDKSCLSLDEIKEEEQRKRKLKAPKDEDDSPDDSFSEYREAFVPADRITEEDRKNDRRSLNRHLQFSLMLLTKGKAGWEPPSCALGQNETLRDAVTRCVVRTVGTSVQTHIVGNAPSGILTIPPSGDSSIGKKIFFLRAVYVDGALSLHKDYSDFVWVPHFEMPEYLAPVAFNAVKPFVF